MWIRYYLTTDAVQAREDLLLHGYKETTDRFYTKGDPAYSDKMFICTDTRELPVSPTVSDVLIFGKGMESLAYFNHERRCRHSDESKAQLYGFLNYHPWTKHNFLGQINSRGFPKTDFKNECIKYIDGSNYLHPVKGGTGVYAHSTADDFADKPKNSKAIQTKIEEFVMNEKIDYSKITKDIVEF